MNQIKIGDREIGDYPYVIAEAGVNHNGSLERAKELIKAAAEAGADAIKFQTYTADELVVKGTPKFWKSEGGDVEGNQYDAYKKLGGFNLSHYPELMKYCEEYGIEFLSTAFSFSAAEYLNNIGMKAFKVASSDMSTLPFLEHIAKFGKPIILSTGASTLEEIKEAVETIENAGNKQIIILHCTLKYPTGIEDANLNLIGTLQKEFPNYPIGISDHTLGITGSIFASVLGAKVIEKHFTIDKTLPDSADHWLSVNPEELRIMIGGIQEGEKMKGYSEKKVFRCEDETRKYDKRSIVSQVSIPKGTVITKDMLTFKRPGTGIWPKEFRNVVGKTALQDINEDTTLQWEMLSKI